MSLSASILNHRIRSCLQGRALKLRIAFLKAPKFDLRIGKTSSRRSINGLGIDGHQEPLLLGAVRASLPVQVSNDIATCGKSSRTFPAYHVGVWTDRHDSGIRGARREQQDNQITHSNLPWLAESPAYAELFSSDHQQQHDRDERQRGPFSVTLIS